MNKRKIVADRLIYCIVCRKRKKRKGSLYCKTCSRKSFAAKFTAFQNSHEFKFGLHSNNENVYGRLPRR